MVRGVYGFVGVGGLARRRDVDAMTGSGCGDGACFVGYCVGARHRDGGCLTWAEGCHGPIAGSGQWGPVCPSPQHADARANVCEEESCLRCWDIGILVDVVGL